jgi:hypothetical protein
MNSHGVLLFITEYNTTVSFDGSMPFLHSVPMSCGHGMRRSCNSMNRFHSPAHASRHDIDCFRIYNSIYNNVIRSNVVEKRHIQRSIVLFHNRNRVSVAAAGGGSEDGGTLSLSQTNNQMKGYRVFKMDGCTFLVKELPDQRLDLNDILVIDDVTQESKPVEWSKKPSAITPRIYQEVEWASEFPGNDLEDKPPMTWVLKVFLVAVESMEPYRLDFDSTVYVLDAATGSISECPVTRLAPVDTPEELIQLRIRETGITIDRADGLPCPETVVRSKLAGVPALSELEQQDMNANDGMVDGVSDDLLITGSQQDDEDDVMSYEEDEDDSLSDFLVEVDDDSDSEYDGDDFGDADGDDDSGGVISID